MLPVRAEEGAAAWMERSAQLLPSVHPHPAAAAAAAGAAGAGVPSRIFSLWQIELDFYSSFRQHVSGCSATDAGRRDLRRQHGGTNR